MKTAAIHGGQSGLIVIGHVTFNLFIRTINLI